MRVNRFLPQGFISFLHRSEGESVLHLMITIAVRRTGFSTQFGFMFPYFAAA